VCWVWRCVGVCWCGGGCVVVLGSGWQCVVVGGGGGGRKSSTYHKASLAVRLPVDPL